MTEKRLPEIDVIRIISILIVVLLIHIPLNYAYNFYYDLDQYGVFFINNVGIFVAMGSFVFVSGFGLFLNINNRNINSPQKLAIFIKKRFLRIYPLYWIALLLFLFFLGYLSIDPLYLLAHTIGLQIIVAPLFGPPMLTLWFIGIIVIYYLIYIVLSFSGSMLRIIPISIAILIFFILLNGIFGLVEHRFFLYYLLFIAGIVTAGIYSSHFYDRIKQHLVKVPRMILLIIPLCLAFLSYFTFQFLCEFCFSYFNLEYGTAQLYFILELNLNFIENASIVLLLNLIMMSFIIFLFSLFNFVFRVFRLIFSKRRIESVISMIAYSTFCVYLFHRIFLIIFDYILVEILNIDIFARENFYVVILYVPFIFLFSFFIQKGMDWVFKVSFNRNSKKLVFIELKKEIK